MPLPHGLTLQLMNAPGDDGVMGAAHRKHFIEGPVLSGSDSRLCLGLKGEMKVDC